MGIRQMDATSLATEWAPLLMWPRTGGKLPSPKSPQPASKASPLLDNGAAPSVLAQGGGRGGWWWWGGWGSWGICSHSYSSRFFFNFFFLISAPLSNVSFTFVSFSHVLSRLNYISPTNICLCASLATHTRYKPLPNITAPPTFACLYLGYTPTTLCLYQNHHFHPIASS